MQRRKQREYLASGICLILMGLGLSWYLWPRPRWNVILVTLDTTRADHVGCYGHESARTPALDALAASGVLFERAYAPVPLTLPSHASLLTGLYPPEHGLHTNGKGRLGAGIPVLAEILRNQRYDTGAFLAAFVLNAKFGLNRGFQKYDDDLAGSEQADDSLHRRREGRSVMDAAFAWLKERRSRPFFCWIHLYDPHFPYRARKETFGDVFEREPYDAGIACVDLQVQRLREFLQSRQLADRTLIVVVGDHGEGLQQHAEKEHGMQLYESTLRVPMIFVAPLGAKPGHRVSTPVSVVDVMPTILDCLNLNPRQSPCSGRSVRAALSGENLEPRPCYAETDSPFLENRWSPLRCVVAERWKYIQTTHAELYDLQNDPGEMHNLAELQSQKRQALDGLLSDLKGKMVPRESSSVQLSQQEQRILASLGYTGGKSPSAPSPPDQRLPDIKEMLPHYNNLMEARMLLDAGRVSDAAAMIRDVIDAAPGYLGAKILLGDALLRQEEFAEAAWIYEDVLAAQPDEAFAHAHLASALAAQGLLREAVSHFRQALEIDSEAPKWHLNLAQTLSRLGNVAEAISEYRESVRTDPCYVDAHLRLAGLLTQIGRADEAIAHYQMALKYHPNLAIAHLNLGTALARERRYAEAVTHSAKAVELEPESFDAHFNLGTILLIEHMDEAAAVQFEEAIRLRPDDPRPRENLQRAKAGVETQGFRGGK